MSPLAGRVAVVAGASRGIGGEVAARFQAEGATVVRLARTLRAALQEKQLDLPCDLTQEADVRHAAERITAQFGVPDVVVSSSGSFLLAPLDQTTVADFDAQVAANLRAPFLLARAFLPAMRQRGQGLFIAVGSVADHRAFPENGAYSAAKFGLRGLHEVLREEYHGSGVRCTLVSPGPVDTSLWDPVDPDHRAGFTPRREMLQAGDVADAVLFIATRPAHVSIDWLRLDPA